MPLQDRHQPPADLPDGGWGFACESELRERVVVRVTSEAVDDTPPTGAGDRAKFEANRGLYLQIASDKFERTGRNVLQPVIVVSADVQG